jgi:fluoroacetyl-CoA thioesterase
MTVRAGLIGTVSRTVTEADTADALGLPGVRVLASPMLCLFAELAAVAALPGDDGGDARPASVGISLEMAHTAATPVGFGVVVEATLVEVDGRRLRFEIDARDEVERIGHGTHVRMLVDWPRFLASVSAKEAARDSRPAAGEQTREDASAR